MTLKFLSITDRPDAIPLVARWWFGEWGDLKPDQTVEEIIHRLQQHKPGELPDIQVAVRDDDVVGAAALKRHEMKDHFPDRLHWLGNVYVGSQFRGLGIGAALADHISDIARERGINKLHLQTKQLDGGVYARLGWQELEQVQHNGNDVVVMVRSLR